MDGLGLYLHVVIPVSTEGDRPGAASAMEVNRSENTTCTGIWYSDFLAKTIHFHVMCSECSVRCALVNWVFSQKPRAPTAAVAQAKQPLRCFMP